MPPPPPPPPPLSFSLIHSLTAPRYSSGSVFTAKIRTHPPTTSYATEEQDDNNTATANHSFIKPLEESSPGSSQGETSRSSSREAVPSISPSVQEMNLDQCKPLTKLKEEVSAPPEHGEQGSEAQLPPGISEVFKQQYTKPDILLRGGLLESSSRCGCAQNRMSCPESLLMKIPENTVIGPPPLVLNANISSSSYCLKGTLTDDYSCEEQFGPGVTEEVIGDGCRQTATNPHYQETAKLCLSDEEERAHHKKVSGHHVISLLVYFVLYFELGGSSCCNNYVINNMAH